MRYSVLVWLLLMMTPLLAVGQDGEEVAQPGRVEPAPVPFGIGERLEYEVKFGPIKAGEAVMEVEGLDTVAGHPTYHLQTVIQGSIPFYKLDDRQQSWLDVVQLASRRFRQDSQQGSYERHRQYEFDLEGEVYERENGETGPIPAGALDEAAFIYFVRAIPLTVGETYEWNRYFKFDRNPVILQVLRRETIEVPAGEFSTLVVRPIIKTGGIFSEGGRAEIYITDDERRIPVRMKSRLKVGSLQMDLTEYTPGDKVTAEMLGRL